MVGKELQKVVFEICKHKGEGKKRSLKNLTAGAPGKARSKLLFNKMKKSATLSISGQMEADDESDEEEMLRMRVNRETFDSVMMDTTIRQKLQSLDISVTSSYRLFDILDADDSGCIEIGELAEGFMKLRGPADKGDTISCLLTVKALQKTIKEMESDQERFRVSVANTLHRNEGDQQKFRNSVAQLLQEIHARGKSGFNAC